MVVQEDDHPCAEHQCETCLLRSRFEEGSAGFPPLVFHGCGHLGVRPLEGVEHGPEEWPFVRNILGDARGQGAHDPHQSGPHVLVHRSEQTGKQPLESSRTAGIGSDGEESAKECLFILLIFSRVFVQRRFVTQGIVGRPHEVVGQGDQAVVEGLALAFRDGREGPCQFLQGHVQESLGRLGDILPPGSDGVPPVLRARFRKPVECESASATGMVIRGPGHLHFG